MGICRDPIQVSQMMASPAARTYGSERHFLAKEYSLANPIRHWHHPTPVGQRPSLPAERQHTCPGIAKLTACGMS